MAQDSRPKRRVADGLSSNTIDFANFHGITTDPVHDRNANNPMVVDPLSDYYLNSFEMLNRDPWIGSLVDRFCHKILSKGFIFTLEDGTICRPNAAFQSIIDAHWIEFFYQAFRFIMCTGFLVWFRGASPQGVNIPVVPDWDQIETKIDYDKKTRMATVTALWRENRSGAPQLYVFHHELHTGVTPRAQRALLDLVKPALFSLYTIDKYMMLLYRAAAEPAIIISDTTAVRRTAAQQHDAIEPTDAIEEFLIQNHDRLGDDMDLYGRINNARSQGGAYSAEDDFAMQARRPFPPAFQARFALSRPFEDQYRGIPGGTQATPIVPGALSGLQYAEMRRILRMEVMSIFEMTDTTAGAIETGAGAKSTTSTVDSKSAAPDTAGAKGSDGSLTYAWMTMAARIATAVLRILHDQVNIQIGDPKPTYAEQRRREMQGEEDQWTADEIFEVAKTPQPKPEEQLLEEREANAPPPKKQKFNNDSEGGGEWGRGGAPKPPPIQKEATPLPIAERRRRFENDDGSPPVITMMPLSFFLAHRDMANLLRQQGGMSDDAFYEMHPPVEKGTDADKQREKEQEKEEQAKKKEEEKIKKEIEKEKATIEKEKETMRKEEMADHKARIKELEGMLTKLKSALDGVQTDLAVQKERAKHKD
jgi:hypothetical protein